MSGELAGITGGRAGTSGEALPWRRFLTLFGILAAFLIFVCIINVSSILTENPPGERNFHVWEPILWEASSVLAALTLLPFLWIGYWRFHWRDQPLWRIAGGQAIIFVGFSLGHVGLMVAIRIAGYTLNGAHYDFAQGNLLLQLIYEMRKDAIAYGILFAAMWVEDRLAKPPAEAAPSDRLEVRADGRTLYLDPADILAIEAAGNYVEVLRADVAIALLIRGTLNQFEARLVPHGFVRVHRSRLVNRRRISSFEGTPSGDVRIRMTDGRELTGSRRYRDNL